MGQDMIDDPQLSVKLQQCDGIKQELHKFELDKPNFDVYDKEPLLEK